MASSSHSGNDGKSMAEIDREGVDKFNRLLKQNIEREERLMRHWEWMGNKLPPMSIEHMPHERNRLSGSGMTAEDRVLRKQWVMDQALAPNEPRVIPELNPKNAIRRAFAVPWNVLFKTLEPMLGRDRAVAGRFYVPRLAIGIVALWASYYHLKYNYQTWETKSGWHFYQSRPMILPGDKAWPVAPQKEFDEFYDKGFKSHGGRLT